MNTNTQNYINVTSNLVVSKSGIFQVVLNYYINNKRKQKWRSLGIKDVPGNKNLAKKKQKEIERQFEDKLNTPAETVESKGSDILFGEYMREWLENTKPTIEPTTYSSYKSKVETIANYFNQKDMTLSNIKKSDIKIFYQHLITTKGIKIETVKRYHANIHKALNEAVDLSEHVLQRLTYVQYLRI